jgi:DNA-binding NarL/FixJ family response regulator
MIAIIADDQSGVRSAVRLLLEQNSRGCLIKEAEDEQSLLREVLTACPDVVILDTELAGPSPAKPSINKDSFQTIIQKLRTNCPNMHIIALSSRSEIRNQALQSGADDFVCKTESPDTLLQVLESICSES